MKAVLWADTLQAFIMIAGLIALLIRGCTKLGGIDEVFRRAEEHGRLQHWEYVVECVSNTVHCFHLFPIPYKSKVIRYCIQRDGHLL